jgi:hypothetical protein
MSPEVPEAPKKPEELILPMGMIDAGHPAFALSGRVADAWAMFEFHIDRTIWGLAAVNDGAGACVTAQFVGVYGRLRALQAVVELAGGGKELRDDLASIAGRSEPLAEERNRIVHDPWMINVTKHTAGKMRITAKKTLHFAYVPVTLPEVQTLLDKIKSHTARFFRFEEKLKAEMPEHFPSAHKSPEAPPESLPPSILP